MFCFVFRNLDLLQEVEVLDAQASLQATLLIIHQHDLDLKRGQDIQDPNLGQDLNPDPDRGEVLVVTIQDLGLVQDLIEDQEAVHIAEITDDVTAIATLLCQIVDAMLAIEQTLIPTVAWVCLA